MRFAFWNTNKKLINSYIVSLVRDFQIDTLILAEYSDDISFLIDSLDFQIVSSTGCDRLKLLSNKSFFDIGPQASHYSFQIVNEDYLLCCLHLISKTYDQDGRRRAYDIEEIMINVEAIKERNNINKVVFVGDFNENPYESNVLEARLFHALPCYYELENDSRIVSGKTYTKYYNPMWNLFGDKDSPPGTFFHMSSSPVEPFWHMFDQVIISKEMFPRFLTDTLRIVTDTSNGPLFRDGFRPNNLISDHFPIVFEIGD